MNGNIIASIQVSILAMGVIFLVLSLLIGVIRVLVHYIPYQAPAAPQARAQAARAPSTPPQDEDHIAAIHAALAHHLGKNPQEIQILNITSI